MDKPSYLNKLKPDNDRIGAYYFRFQDLELKEDIQKWCLHHHQPMSKWLERAAKEQFAREVAAEKNKPDLLIRR